MKLNIFKFSIIICILFFITLSNYIFSDFKIKNGKIVNQNNGPVEFDLSNSGNSNITMSANGDLGIGIAVPEHTLHIGGTVGFGFQTVSTNITVSGNTMHVVDTTTGNVQLTLPLASVAPGRIYKIKKINIANDVIVVPSGADKIDLVTQVVLSSNTTLGSLNLVSSGANWQITSIIGGNGI
jgi:hypothetical protein